MNLKLCTKGKIPDHNNVRLPSVEQSEEKQLSVLLYKQTHIPFWLCKPTPCWFSLAATRHYYYYLVKELRYRKESPAQREKSAQFLCNINYFAFKSKKKKTHKMGLILVSFLTQ